MKNCAGRFDSSNFARAASMVDMELNGVAIFFRWIHIVSACILVGSVYYFQFLLPAATRELDPAAAQGALARTRRPLKLTIHTTLILFLVSGTYNALRNWPIYTKNPGIMHGLFGMHVLLALGALTALLLMLAGREPKAGRAGWAKGALIALLLAVALASTLKSAREWTAAHPHAALPVQGHSTTQGG